MSYFDKPDPLAYWKSQTRSLIASRRGRNQPVILKIDALLQSYKDATADGARLGILDTLYSTLSKWLATYSGGRATAANQLLTDTKLKRESFKTRGVVATGAPGAVAMPRAQIPDHLARNKNPGDKYYTLGMLAEGGLGKDLNNGALVSNLERNERSLDRVVDEDAPLEWRGLTYMNEKARVRFLVEVRAGLLYLAGSLLDTNKSHITQGAISNKVFIYVMDGRGRIFSAAKTDVEHHSSFLAGNPAAAAGMWKVTAGKVEYINAQSGHYCPMKDEVDQLLAELRAGGVDTSKIDIPKLAVRTEAQARARARGVAGGARLYPTGPRLEYC